MVSAVNQKVGGSSPPRETALVFLYGNSFVATLVAQTAKSLSNESEQRVSCNAGDPDLILGSGRSSGEGHGNPRQYCCLQNSMDREAWWDAVHGVASQRVGHDWATNTSLHFPHHITSNRHLEARLWPQLTLQLPFTNSWCIFAPVGGLINPDCFKGFVQSSGTALELVFCFTCYIAWRPLRLEPLPCVPCCFVLTSVGVFIFSVLICPRGLRTFLFFHL